MLKSRLLMALFLAASLHAAAEENIGRVQSPLISNVIVSDAEKENLGLLEMNANGRGCSASLLTNNWVLSASHCMLGPAVRMPNNVQLTADWGVNTQRVNADYIYRSWGLDYPGVMYDFTLIHLQRPIQVNGSVTGYVRELTELSLNDMKNVNVAVYGRGMNVLAVKNGNTFMPSSGDGEFRSFVFTVNRLEPNLFWYPKGPKGEMVGGGDSGGPSFEMSRGVPRIAGVHALCHADCLPGRSCPASDQWTWVSAIQECGDAPAGNFRGAVYELMQQVWNPALPMQTVQVRHSEAQVRKELLLGQVDTLPWDYVRRAAMMACQNRGFDFGFFDGNAQPGVRYQARCLNASVARWFDAVPADMARINDRFATISQTGWAQGARAANDICKNRDATSVGGMFTGFEVKTAPAGGFADQRDGVFCFNNASATWFDSTQGELARQGTPIGDLNNTSWAVAGRAATEYCRKKFYPAGGFFNGHQSGDKRGVICLGPNSIVSDRVKVGDSYGAARVEAATGGKTSGAAGAIAQGALTIEASAARAPSAMVSAMRAGQTPAAAPVAAPATVAPAVTVFYAVEGDGTLSEYRHDRPEAGTAPNRFAPTSNAWNTYNEVIPAGGNHFYARAQNGDLLWYQHDGVGDGANAWRGPVQVGNGWQSFTKIFGGGNGVIYAIAADGTLMWYRHAGFANGDARAWSAPKKIGTGWGSFKNVFSAGEGVIYAVTPDGKLMVYRHLDPMNGEMRWSGPAQVGTGWNGFAQLFSTGNGVIYGLAADGKLSYYRHLTWNAATPTFSWVGPVAVGQSFNPAARIVPMLP